MLVTLPKEIETGDFSQVQLPLISGEALCSGMLIRKPDSWLQPLSS